MTNLTKVDLFDMDNVFFPFNIGNWHWALIVANMCEETIVFYDSYKDEDLKACTARKNKYVKYVRDYLVEEERRKSRKASCPIEWAVVEVEVPQQKNGYDCGICVLMFIEALLNADNIAEVTLKNAATLAYRKRISDSIKNDYEAFF